jgi:phosphoglycerate dehydrogenase-like enzyme
MARIAVLDDYQGAAAQFGEWSSLPADVEVVYFGDHAPTADALVARLRHFDIVYVMRERSSFPREVLERLPELRLLVTAGPRNAVIDVEAAKDMGVLVCGTDGHYASTPEFVWGLILAVLRNIPQEYAMVRAGGWQHTIGGDLSGQTLGVIGLGNMGSYVARIGKAFDMNVIAWSENLTKERCAEQGVQLVSKEDLFATSDIVTVHLQLSPRTLGLIGAAELGLMKSHAIFINTSRGPIVDERALTYALSSGVIRAAGVDVYEPEPMAPDHPFRTLHNIVATPHIGYVTRNCYEFFIGQAVEDIKAYLAGSPIRIIEHN